ncbi:hypothetical protein AHMF7605_00565 [Adhaeribacter arboris]|uniref:Uncharacterized protein n=1 Tax=Adhaeribacter arboris TaxID=2072846 RepID=A0A2T2Y9L6_9BACT|nr:hypothetical protein [Adhaeribacter arboris]PSR52118.1 hypothetical protein AHMF7605_00565 [Adhaeribacter arboris]
MKNKGFSTCIIFIAAVLFSCNSSLLGKKVDKLDWMHSEPNYDSLQMENRRIGKNYLVVDSSYNSDFNYNLLNAMDSLIEASRKWPDAERFFLPVAGKYKYYRFKARFKGVSYDNSLKDFNDILIIKTDSVNTIIDAYQYTLEWAEYPFTTDLYRISNKGERLVDKLNVDSLEMKKIADYENGKLLDDKGIIYLKPKK